jgi:hypothetical protein
MSALPPIADISGGLSDVRFVPIPKSTVISMVRAGADDCAALSGQLGCVQGIVWLGLGALAQRQTKVKPPARICPRIHNRVLRSFGAGLRVCIAPLVWEGWDEKHQTQSPSL